MGIENKQHALKVVFIVFVLQLAVLLGTAFVFSHYGGSIAHEINSQDAREYMILGEHLLLDGNLKLPDQTVLETWRTPGYPLFVAVVFALTGHSLSILLVILALVGAMTSGCIYLIGRELSLSHRWSFVAALIFGISPAVIWIPPSGMGGDILFTFLFTAGLYALVRLNQVERWYLVAGAMGLLFGAATLVRPLGLHFTLILLVALPFFALRAALKKSLQAGVITLICFLLVIVPWMARNQAVAGHFSISSQFAFNPFYYNIPIYFAWKNNTNEEAERTKVIESVTPLKWTRLTNPYPLVNGFTYYDEEASFAKEFLRENFLPYLGFHAYKTLPFFIGSGVNVIYATVTNEIPNMPDVPFFPRAVQNTATLFYGDDYSAVIQNLSYYWPSTLERIVWLVAFILAFAAPLLVRGRERRFAILGVVFILMVGLLATPIAQPRYRIPAEPFIWLGAALALSRLTQKLREKVSLLQR